MKRGWLHAVVVCVILGLLLATVGVVFRVAGSLRKASVEFKPRVGAGSRRTEVPLYPLQSVHGPDDPIQRLFAVPVQLNGRAGLFLLDTGASVAAVSERFARAIGVSEIQSVAAETNFGVNRVNVFRAKSLRVGQMIYQEFDVLILPLQHLQEWTHTDLDGILGGNVLNRVPYQLNPVGRRLLIDPQIRLSKTTSVSISIRHGQLIVPVWVNTRPSDFIVDTGASQSLVREQDLAAMFGSEQPPVRVETTRVVDIKNDRVIERQTVALPPVRVGDAVVDGLDAGMYEVNLLGQDFLGRFVLTVDGPRQRLTLTVAAEP